MARRSGRKGDFLAADDYTGFTEFGSRLKLDFWGQRTRKPLLRNLQEIATPLDDPYPLPFYRGSNYEQTNGCIAEVAPAYVGLTTVPTNTQNAAMQVLNLNPAIPDMEVGCTFVVR